MPSNVKVSASPMKSKGKVSFKATNQGPLPSVGKGREGKRKRKEDEEGEDDEEEEGDEDVNSEGDEEGETDEEIERAQAGKSKKTAKRKRRATSPTTFGTALQGLLGSEADGGEVQEEKEVETVPSQARDHKANGRSQQHQQPSTILALAPHVRRSAQSSVLNAKAARLALEAKKKREDRAHVSDIIAGWGAPGQLPKTEEGEEKIDDEDVDKDQMQEWRNHGGSQGYEKRLRKVAQRGVVKLFNAIRAAQNTTESDVEESRTQPQATKQGGSSSMKKGENPLGGKAKAVHEMSKNNFLDLIRSGATKSRTG